MSATLTTLGIFHTAISIVPLPLGLWAFLRDGKIDYGNRVGKVYWWTMFVASVTAFGIFRTGHFTAGHALSLATLALIFLGAFAEKWKWLGGSIPYVTTFSFSASYLLLLFFATTETLTHLPASQPFAASPTDPALLPVRFALLGAFVLGLGYQWFELNSANRNVPVFVRKENALSSGAIKL